MGGRGQRINGVQYTEKGTKAIAFYDRTEQYKDYTLHEYEAAIRHKKTEYVGLFDKNGKLIKAGTTGEKGIVALPPIDNWNDVAFLTHNHPNGGKGGIGGTLSGIDMVAHAQLGIYQTRAVGGGKHEYLYIVQKTENANPAKLKGFVGRHLRNDINKTAGKKTVAKVKKSLKKKGKKMNETQKNAAFIGGQKLVWKNSKFEETGYVYTERKKPY